MGKRILLATSRLHLRSQLSPHGVVTGTPNLREVLLPARSRETSENGVPEPLSRRHTKHRPRGLSPLGRARLVTGLAAERGPFPPRTSSGAGMQGQRPLLPEVAAPFSPLSSPWAFPRSGPRPPRPLGLPKPSPRDSQWLPTTQHPGRETGLSRRSCCSHHPVTGLRSVTTTAAALFLRLLGAPPTSLTANEKRGRQATTLRRPAEALPRRKAKRLSEIEWKGRGGVRSRNF